MHESNEASGQTKSIIFVFSWVAWIDFLVEVLYTNEMLSEKAVKPWWALAHFLKCARTKKCPIWSTHCVVIENIAFFCARTPNSECVFQSNRGVINMNDFFRRLWWRRWCHSRWMMVLTRVRLITLEITLMNWNEMHAQQNRKHRTKTVRAKPANQCFSTIAHTHSNRLFTNERINQIKIHHSSRDR